MQGLQFDNVPYVCVTKGRAAELYQQSALQGVKESMYRHADLLWRSQREGSNDEVVRWLSKAASQKEARALRRLGEFYEKGWSGLHVDFEKAVEQYRQLTQMEDPKGMCRLARCYQYGKGDCKKSCYHGVCC